MIIARWALLRRGFVTVDRELTVGTGRGWGACGAGPSRLAVPLERDAFCGITTLDPARDGCRTLCPRGAGSSPSSEGKQRPSLRVADLVPSRQELNRLRLSADSRDRRRINAPGGYSPRFTVLWASSSCGRPGPGATRSGSQTVGMTNNRSQAHAALGKVSGARDRHLPRRHRSITGYLDALHRASAHSGANTQLRALFLVVPRTSARLGPRKAIRGSLPSARHP